MHFSCSVAFCVQGQAYMDEQEHSSYFPDYCISSVPTLPIYIPLLCGTSLPMATGFEDGESERSMGAADCCYFKSPLKNIMSLNGNS